MVFQDRKEAGALLAAELKKLKLLAPFVIAIPRGGVVIGKVVATKLQAPLDIIVCRKLGVPNHKELGFGAIAPNGILILNNDLVNSLQLSNAIISTFRQNEERELARRVATYRGIKPMPNLKNKEVILIDDGIATGITTKAAIMYLNAFNPKSVILAAPVCAADTKTEIKSLVDKTVFLSTPKELYAVGQFYLNFPQVSDAEVEQLLR